MSAVEVSRGGLLSVEQSAARPRALRSWGTADRARLARAVADRWEQWRTSWGVEPEGESGVGASPSGEIRCESLHDAAERGRGIDRESWQPAGAAGAGLWWTLSSPSSPATGARPQRTTQGLSFMARALFGAGAEADASLRPRAAGADAPQSMAAELAGAAWTDWWKRLAGAAEITGPVSAGDAGGAPPEVTHAWSGALVVELPLAGRSLLVLMTAERVARLLGPATVRPEPRRERSSAALIPVERAVAQRTARVHVRMQAFEIDLGALAALSVGDVLRTAHRLDAALSVAVAGQDRIERPMCAGFLGKSGARRAVELMRPSTRGSEQPMSEHQPAHAEERAHARE